jgi:HTH-type transcriptional regulator / antitoxin HipB
MIIHTPRDLGAFIRDRRRRLGLDQRRLAEKVGVSRQWIIAVEHGKPRAELGLVIQTLNVLGTSIKLGDPPAARKKAAATVDIDAIVQKARKPHT